MGWREALWRAINAISHDFDGPPDRESMDVLQSELRKMPAPDRIDLARELLAGTGRMDVAIALMEAAHACMRETGWQLAPAHAHRGSDGVLEAACAEVVEQVQEALDACRAAMLVEGE